MSTSSAFVSAATHAPLVDGPPARQLEAIDLALQRLAKTGSTRTTLLLVNLARFSLRIRRPLSCKLHIPDRD